MSDTRRAQWCIYLVKRRKDFNSFVSGNYSKRTILTENIEVNMQMWRILYWIQHFIKHSFLHQLWMSFSNR